MFISDEEYEERLVCISVLEIFIGASYNLVCFSNFFVKLLGGNGSLVQIQI